MKSKYSAFLVATFLLASCQGLETPAPTSFPASETSNPIVVDFPTSTPKRLLCDPSPSIVDWHSLSKIPDDHLPSPRVYATMTYDQIRKVIIMFGGVSDADTWEYDGTEWHEISTNTLPPGRSFASMTYDFNRGVVVMYGGYYKGSPFPNDIWEYDGKDWIGKELENSPESLRFPVITYYPPWGKVILFSEYGDSATYQTWTYDGVSWDNLNQDLPDIPMPSMLYQTVYDSCRQKLYLQMLSNWTYEFDGDVWHVIYEGMQPYIPIPFANTVYDSRRNVVVLYGTQLPGNWKSETWEFDGVDWQQVQPLDSPPPRSGHAMAFDEERGVTVMFGGATQDGTLLNDTWEYDGTTWVQR
jgi:hypothetical protein